MKSFVSVLFRALLLISCIFTFLLPIQKARAQEEDIPNEFIFQVLLPPVWTISEAVFAYEINGKYYLPIAEISKDLDFFVDIETEGLYATGFAGGEDNTFTIEQKRNELIMNGQRESIPEDSILVSDYLATDDLYVQLELLNKIWPVEMSIDLSRLTINIEASEDLPFMKRKEREEKRKKIEERQVSLQERRKVLPQRPNPYSWFGKPAIDYQGTYTYDDEEDDLTGTNVFTGTQQIGKMLAEFSATFRLLRDRELERPDNVRLKFSRKSAGKDFLAPGIRNFEFGDVTLRQRDLISSTESGRGVVISNDNKDIFNEFDEITIEGTGPPGWEIELYNNEELIEFGIVPDDGLYFFEDVILNYGNNQIKLLFFGPQGQIREETRSYTAGGNMLPPGQLIYNAGFLDADREFILLANEPRTTPRGVIKTLSSSYGVNSWLTVFGNYTEIPENDKDRTYQTAGAAISTPVGLFETEAYNETAGGNALAVDYITSFLGIRTNLGVARFNDFESTDSGFGTNKKTFEADGQFNKLIKIASIPIGLRLNTTHTERKTGAPVTTVDFAQTLSAAGLRVSHSTTSRFNDFVHESTSAGITTTAREGPWQLRGSINYDIHPLFEMDSFTSELRYRAENSFQAALNFGHNFKSSDYQAGFQLGYDFKKVLASFESRYDKGDGWDFVLRATSSLNPYTPDGRYEFSSQQKRQASPINAHVYLDRDSDGEFGEGDEPLEGVRLRVGPGATKTETNEEGQILAYATADKLTNFQIEKSSLEDPYFVPATEGFSTIPARGGVIQASFPVVETGAIEGTVFRDDNNQYVAGLTLELLDEAGEVINTVVSAFDGYYAFEFVRPGPYSIRAEASHNVALLENVTSVTADELFVYGNDLLVQIPEHLAKRRTSNNSAQTFGPFTEGDPEHTYGPFIQDVNPAPGFAGETEPFGPPLPALEPENEPLGPVDHNPQTLASPPTPEIEAKTELQIQPSQDPDNTAIQEARFKAHNEAARLVIEATDQLTFSVLPATEPNKIKIQISETIWGAQTEQEIQIADKSYNYSIEQTPNGPVLVIASDHAIALKRSMALPGKAGADSRLVIDVN